MLAQISKQIKPTAERILNNSVGLFWLTSDLLFASFVPVPWHNRRWTLWEYHHRNHTPGEKVHVKVTGECESVPLWLLFIANRGLEVTREGGYLSFLSWEQPDRWVARKDCCWGLTGELWVCSEPDETVATSVVHVGKNHDQPNPLRNALINTYTERASQNVKTEQESCEKVRDSEH